MMSAGLQIATDLPERPLSFEAAGGAPLYGVFHGARVPRAADVVALFCPSLGLDHLVTWRNEVCAARALAARGYPAFSYHPRGHGDSAGSFAEVTFETLVEDAEAAAQQARTLSGASRIVWIATRFGALVAASAMNRRGDAAGLALWEPIHRGADHFQGLMRRVLFREVAAGRGPALTVAGLLEQLARDGEIPLVAEWLHERLYLSAKDVDLARALDGWRGSTMLAQVRKPNAWSTDNAALIAKLREAGAPVSAIALAEEPTWENPAEPWWTSAPLIAQTIKWLDGMA